MSKRLVVIGGGAAGFFCAVNAAALNPQLKVTILEKTNRLLSKVKVSGGGRCNVTHACFDIAEMSKQYPRGHHFVRKAFHQFFTRDTIKWFEDRDVSLTAESDGRMFPVTNTSQTIIDCLMREANRYGIDISMRSEVISLTNEDGTFKIRLGNGAVLSSDFVCVSCGGYSRRGLFDWLTRLGHSIEAPVPSLFTFNLPNHPIVKLMGVSVGDVHIKIPGFNLSESGPLLITHWGLSGPVVLRLSAWGARQLASMNWQFRILVNWLPGYTETRLQEKFRQLRAEIGSSRLKSRNPFELPQRLWEFILIESSINLEARWGELKSGEQHSLTRNLCAGEFDVRGKTTFKEEFVTAGGIVLSEINVNTMMSKRVPNLFFAGEILDVDGITGGFNFQHAWTSGFIAAKTIASL